VRSALDLRAEVACGAWWCDHLMKKGFLLVQSFFPNQFEIAVSLALRAMRAAPLARFRSNSACVQCQWQHFVFLS
jgi:hypothetical protein